MLRSGILVATSLHFTFPVPDADHITSSLRLSSSLSVHGFLLIVAATSSPPSCLSPLASLFSCCISNSMLFLSAVSSAGPLLAKRDAGVSRSTWLLRTSMYLSAVSSADPSLVARDAVVPWSTWLLRTLDQSTFPCIMPWCALSPIFDRFVLPHPGKGQSYRTAGSSRDELGTIVIATRFVLLDGGSGSEAHDASFPEDLASERNSCNFLFSSDSDPFLSATSQHSCQISFRAAREEDTPIGAAAAALTGDGPGFPSRVSPRLVGPRGRWRSPALAQGEPLALTFASNW
mmetsp:Transcript_28654/g.64670  ORF Transcript_28654/g.64670 Transcript_28654/m.64670 type:complete len:289 (-) Transcript_28654:1020-1886(-)